MRASTFRLSLVLLAITAISVASGQSFNVDIDSIGSPPEGGGGAPSVSFGAAAGQAGFWNSIPPINLSSRPLLDLNGAATGVTFTASGSGGGGAWNNPSNTDDFALLLNDSDAIGVNFQYTISGLAQGTYLVYTYAIRPNGLQSDVDVVVPGSVAPETRHLAGVMPGNQFILGVTHAVHQVTTTSGVIQIQATAPQNNQLNGFQLVAVPEPLSIAALAVGTALSMRIKVKIAW